jgi:hypothetical protein
MCGGRPLATVVLPYGEEHTMAGTDQSFTSTFTPFDNSGLRDRLDEQIVQHRSIEAELRALMAERESATETKRGRVRKGRWD